MDEKCILDPQRDCLGLQKASMLENQMSEWRENARKTHKELYDRVRDLEKRDAARDEQYDTIVKKLDKLIAWQESEQSAPRKRVDALVDKVIWAVLAAVIAFALARVGL